MTDAPFIIYGMPRSRTAWLAAFLTYRQWTCHHDALTNFTDIHDVPKFLGAPYTGMCETSMAFAGPVLAKMMPDARIVVVRRPVEEIVRSLKAFGVKLSADYFERESAYLDAISDLPNSLTIDFKDLETEGGCEAVFDHCLNLPLDREWWGALRAQNIQVDLKASIAQGRAHARAIEVMRDQCKDLLENPTIQNETWEAFIADGQYLISEHREEVGPTNEYPFDPDYDLAARAYSLGMLQITTARVAGELVGYIMCQIERMIESKSILRGVQIPFYVRKEYRGKTGPRLHAFMRNSLKEKGVKILTMRSGIRGAGEKQEALFRRLGAKEDGRMFTLKLSA